MEKRITKLQQAQEQELAAQETAQSKNAREFATEEELLRYDATHIAVPPSIAQKLNQSMSHENLPPLTRPWWQRWFGRGKGPK